MSVWIIDYVYHQPNFMIISQKDIVFFHLKSQFPRRHPSSIVRFDVYLRLANKTIIAINCRYINKTITEVIYLYIMEQLWLS